MMLGLFSSERACDPYSPEAPSLIARKFDIEREIPELEAQRLLESLFEGDTYKRAAARASGLLGRPLEAFDIWFNGFGSRGPEGREGLDEAVLDAITRRLYPRPTAFQADIPRILGVPASDLDPVANLRPRRPPALLLASSRDVIAPPCDVEELQLSCAASSELFVLAEPTHEQLPFELDSLMQPIRRWLARRANAIP